MWKRILLLVGVLLPASSWGATNDKQCEADYVDETGTEVIIVCDYGDPNKSPGIDCPPGWIPQGTDDCVPAPDHQPSGGSGSGGGGAGDDGGGGGGSAASTVQQTRDALVNLLEAWVSPHDAQCIVCTGSFQACGDAAEQRELSCESQMMAFAKSQCAKGRLINGTFDPTDWGILACTDGWMNGTQNSDTNLTISIPPAIGIGSVYGRAGLKSYCDNLRGSQLSQCFTSNDCSEVCQ